MAGRLLSDIANLLHLTFQGDDAEVFGVNTLEKAGAKEISFLANPKYLSMLAQTKAAAVIVRPEHASQVRRALISETPYQDFGRVLTLFSKTQGSFQGISPLASISPDAVLEPEVTVYPFVFIGPRVHIGAGSVLFPGCYIGEDCHIGKKCLLYPNVVLMARVFVGDSCILHPGSVLGGDGFGFSKSATGIEKIPQNGIVKIGNQVEIGVNSAVDRAVLDATCIGDGTKIDNLVQIGHNVQVGRNCFLVSQVGVSGSTHIGDNCTFAGQVGVAGHLHIGNNVTLGPQSGVPKDIPDNSIMGGTPAVDQGIFMRTIALMPRFPELFKRLAKLEKAFATQTPKKQTPKD